ncbi:MAG: sulfatase-like hydrolase/transferase [Elusimicrobia bacterium]|nr:sulfatase-like hydrolase/transferase [Elusimicrobiota bacterium]
MKNFRLSGLPLWELIRQWAIVSGRDAVATTRASLVSVEARVGAVVFVVLALWSGLRAPAWTALGPSMGGEIVDGARAWWSGRLILWNLGLGVVHAVLGAGWGLVVKNAWGLLGRLAPRWGAARFRTGLVAGATAGLLLLAHGLLLWRDMGRHPALYEALRPIGEGPGFWQWMALAGAPGLVSGAAVLFAGVLVGAALAFVGWRWRIWFWGFSRPTRLAIGVLGGAAILFGVGLWGVRRAQTERNAGPNVVLITVDGLRSAALRDAGAPRLAAWAAEGQVWARCVPGVEARAPAFTTALTGLSPLAHGVRHDFPPAADRTPPPAGDLGPAPDTLVDIFQRKGAWVTVRSAAGGEFFDRLGTFFEDRRAPRGDLGSVLRRRCLERAVHLLPYFSGRWGRAVWPGLRGAPALADPALLADEVRGTLRRARFRPRFFLWVHFADLAGPVASPAAARRLSPAGRGSFLPGGDGRTAVPWTAEREARRARVYAANLAAWDRAFGVVLDSLDRYRLRDRTTVALWSPTAAALTGAEEDAARALRGGTFLAAPFAFQSPGGAQGIWRDGPVRAIDVPATLVAAVGGGIPEDWEGVSLLRGVGLPPDERGIVYAESPSPVTRGIPPAEGAPPALVDALIEDRDAPGHWRVDPGWEDDLIARRSRLIQWGAERLVYRPAGDRVIFEYYRPGVDGAPGRDEAATPAGAARVRELKEVFYRYLAREAGGRPQNDYWIPEALLRCSPAAKGAAHDR